MRPQAAAMKALLDQPGLQIMPGCGDGMGARLIEEAGFRTGFVSGSSIAAMRLAMPDMDLLTFPEMADAVETVISAAPNVLWGRWRHRLRQRAPVLKTIRAYARRGAAAVLIEDKVWPRPLGHGGAKLVIERDAALLRCRAAPPRRHVARRASCRSTTQVIFRLRTVVRPPAAARARPWSPRPLCSGSA